jgi:hypothetical protein
MAFAGQKDPLIRSNENSPTLTIGATGVGVIKSKSSIPRKAGRPA